ncbi:MAG: BMC domain-containing protein [Firmicutes bacterium]|nr:BMC domain-containing protein [Bacillota bacterium]
MNAIGLVEFNSIAKGIEAGDAMLKASRVELLDARPICPGKYIVLIWGEVSAVYNSVQAGNTIGRQSVVDDFVIPNVHPSVIEAISCATDVTELKALGVIESFSIAALVVAADSAVKAGQVDLIEIRLGTGIGGKSYVTLTGDVGDVTASVNVGKETCAERAMLVESVVIPSPHKALTAHIL